MASASHASTSVGGNAPVAPTAGASGAVSVAGAVALSDALFSAVKPSVGTMSARLVELQEAQHMLVATVNLNRQELADGNDEWRAARLVLDRVPEYREKLIRIRRNMLATQGLLTRVEKGAVLLRSKLAEKAAERAARRSAEQAAFQNVSGPR